MFKKHPHSSGDKRRAILRWGTKYKIMKSYFSTKPGATFFLGSSRTLVYHKDDVEIIYKTKTPSGKTYYAHVYLMLGGENSVTLYADWGGKTDW